MRRSYLWAALAAIGVLLLVPAAFADPGNGRSALNGSVPPWATAANFKGATPSDDAVGFRVYLGLRNADQAAALAKAVSDPSSSSYHKFLTPGDFRNSFAPTQAQVGNVKSWLQSQGFTIDYTPTNNHYVAAEGTAAQVESAFAVKLNQYSVNGLTLRAPSSNLTIPSSVASDVVGVLGIDDGMAFAQPLNRADTNAPPSGGFRNAPPCSRYWAEKMATTLPQYDGQTLPYAPCGYTPPQLRQAYGTGQAGADGSGITVAVVDAYASPTIESDVNQYIQNNDSGHPLAPNQFKQMIAPGTQRRPENSRQDPQGWYGEETLDIEAVHAMAPGANILFVGAPNNYRDLDAAVNHIVDRRSADIITNSYGFPTEFLAPGYIKPVNDTFIQAALEGITVLFSSGDNGDELGILGYRTADWPASSPWVTAVGGTSLAAGDGFVPGTTVGNGVYQFETGWSTTRNRLGCTIPPATLTAWCSTETYLYGSGGGTSRLFGLPDWQSGVTGIMALAQPSGFTPGYARPGRVVPDISADGDPNTGMLIGQTQAFPDGSCPGGTPSCYGEFRIGGTSLASPLMAGMFALSADLHNGSLGFVNPLLYTDASVRGAIRDVRNVSTVGTKGVVRVDYRNGLNASGGLLYTVRRLDYESDPTRTVVSPAFPNGDYNTTIHTTDGYDDMTGLGSPTSAFYAALAAAVK